MSEKNLTVKDIMSDMRHLSFIARKNSLAYADSLGNGLMLIEQLKKENESLKALAIQVINIKNPKDVVKARNRAMLLAENKEK